MTSKIPAPKNQKPAQEQAIQHGLDLSLIESNLRKSPLERIRAHDRAITEVLQMRAALKKTRDKI